MNTNEEDVMNVSINCDVNGLVEALRQLGYDIAEASQPYLVHLYEVYVRQAYLMGCLLTTISCIGLVGVIVGIILITTERNWNKDPLRGPIGIGAAILGVMIAIPTLTEGLLRWLNPEFYAIQNLLAHLPK